MAEKLITVKEPKIKSGFTYENIVADVYSLIKDNPYLNENITDYTSADSVRMLTELFAWITDQLSQRLDLMSNELFLDTVENKENLLKILKVIGFELELPESAEADFEIKVDNYAENTSDTLYLSNGVLDENNNISLEDNSFKRVAHDLSGRTFELITFDEEEGKYDYFSSVSIKTKEINNKKFYEGKTSSLSFSVDTSGYFTKTINEPVIRNSIRVFYTAPVNGEILELKQVDNFFGPESVNSEVPVFRITNLGGGFCRVIFPSLQDVAERNLLKLGDEITILYRTGGGATGNIGNGELISLEEIWLDNNRRGYLEIKNVSKGVGGKNEDSLEEIRRKAPSEIRNRISAVTSDDYEYILKSSDTSIRDIKAYGENNLPEDSDIIGTYGYSKNPLDVWLFIIKENRNYSNEIVDITDYVNDISFQTLDLNERLNEVYQINKASLNFELETEEEKIIYDTLSDLGINSYYSLRLPEEFIRELGFVEQEYRDEAFVAITVDPLSERDSDITGEDISAEYYLEESYALVDNEKVDRKTLRFDGEDIVPIFEDVLPVISAEASGTFSGELIFDFGEGNKTIPITENTSIEDLVNELNIQMNILLNGSFPTVVLVDNITDEEEPISIPTGTVVLEIEEGAETFTYSFEASGGTWEDLPATILLAEDSEGNLLSEKYECALVDKTYEDADCKILALFTDRPEISKFYVSSVVLSLDHEESKGIVKKDSSGDWTSEIKDYFFYIDGVLYFENPHNNLIISFSNTSLFLSLFGISPDKFFEGKFTLGNKRALTILGNNLIIGVPNSLEKLPELLYISGLWGKNTSIPLGSYYENIEESAVSIAPAIKKLLKRGPLKSLYNTITQEPSKYEKNYNSIDIYNSEYEVKLTRRKLKDQTYFQVGENSNYPEIRFITSVLNIPAGGTLYLKVDRENYSEYGVVQEDYKDVSVPIPYKEGDIEGEINNYAETKNGYVGFNLSSFNNRNIIVLLEAIEKVFSYSEAQITIFSRGDMVGFRSGTNYYYSCLDFGETEDVIMAYLFGVTQKEQREFYSSDSYVPLERRDFLKFTLKEETFEPNFDIVLITKEGNFTVNTGTSKDSFINNLSFLSENKIIFREPNIILNDRSNGAFFSLLLESDSEDKIELAKKMFFDTEDREIDSGIGYSIFINKEVEGDYYINNENGVFRFYPTYFDKYPLGDLYFHMLEDYRYDHNYGSENTKILTDEYSWNNMVEKKKMLCVSHVYRQPKFIPFSAKIRLKISKNVSFKKKEEFSKKAYDVIVEAYNIYSSSLGRDIYQADIRNLLLDIPGVLSVDIDYLGFDLQNMASSQNSLPSKFNEKLIASSKKEKEFAVVNESGERTIEKVSLQGIFIDVSYAK